MSLRDEIVRMIEELVIATEDGHVIGDVGTTADAMHFLPDTNPHEE